MNQIRLKEKAATLTKFGIVVCPRCKFIQAIEKKHCEKCYYEIAKGQITK